MSSLSYHVSASNCYDNSFTPFTFGGWHEETKFEHGVMTSDRIIGCGATKSSDVSRQGYNTNRPLIVASDFNGH